VPFAQDGIKTYRFTVAWGASTTTLDREGAVVAESARRPSVAEVEAVLPALTGAIDQVPPAFSAVRVDGERAYDLARAGETVALEARPVHVHALRVADAPDADRLVLEAECGKGTYVRALARDLASALGAEAHVAELIRTRVGPFTLAAAIALESLLEMGYDRAASEGLLPVETALDDIPALAVTAEDAFRLSQGRSIVLLPRQVEALRDELGLTTDAGASRVVSAMEGKRIVALGELRAGRVDPVRVFNL
jgi:tRNA pseudouridine55 synthase